MASRAGMEALLYLLDEAFGGRDRRRHLQMGFG